MREVPQRLASQSEETPKGRLKDAGNTEERREFQRREVQGKKPTLKH